MIKRFASTFHHLMRARHFARLAAQIEAGVLGVTEAGPRQLAP